MPLFTDESDSDDLDTDTPSPSPARPVQFNIISSSDDEDTNSSKKKKKPIKKKPIMMPSKSSIAKIHSYMLPSTKKKNSPAPLAGGSTATSSFPDPLAGSSRGSSSPTVVAAHVTSTPVPLSDNSSVTEGTESTDATSSSLKDKTVKLATFQSWNFYKEFEEEVTKGMVVNVHCIACTRRWAELEIILSTKPRKLWPEEIRLAHKGTIDMAQMRKYALDGTSTVHKNNLKKHVNSGIHKWCKSRDMELSVTFLRIISFRTPPHSYQSIKKSRSITTTVLKFWVGKRFVTTDTRRTTHDAT